MWSATTFLLALLLQGKFQSTHPMWSATVENPQVASSIYRDIGYLLGAKGDNDEAIKYFEGALDTFPETLYRSDIEKQIIKLKLKIK